MKNLPLIISVALWALPICAGGFDFACWFVIAQQCSSIPWMADQAVRVVLVLMWTILVPLVAAGLS